MQGLQLVDCTNICLAQDYNMTTAKFGNDGGSVVVSLMMGTIGCRFRSLCQPVSPNAGLRLPSIDLTVYLASGMLTWCSHMCSILCLHVS